MKHKIMLEKICSPTELNQIDTNLFKDDNKLFDKLIEKNIAMVLDWKYEPPEDIKQFIENRITQLNLKPIDLKVETLEKEYEQLDDDERDGFLPFAFEKIEKQLKKIKVRFVFLETGNDSYVIFIAESKSAKNLTKIKSDFWRFSTLDRANNAILYIIHCPNCNRMDIWELPIENRPPYEGGNLKTEPSEPYEQYCDSCHCLYWDKQGKVNDKLKIEVEACYSPNI